jgi:hypothetical protein
LTLYFFETPTLLSLDTVAYRIQGSNNDYALTFTAFGFQYGGKGREGEGERVKGREEKGGEGEGREGVWPT